MVMFASSMQFTSISMIDRGLSVVIGKIADFKKAKRMTHRSSFLSSGGNTLAQMHQMPAEAIQQLTEAVKAGQPDQHGVTPLNLFMGNGGEGYCLTEAPNADAVCQAHASQGVPLENGDVHEVTSLV